MDIKLEKQPKKIQGFENKAYRRILGIHYKGRKTNVYVNNIITKLIWIFKPLLPTIKRLKLKMVRTFFYAQQYLNTIMQGMVEGQRKRDRTKRTYIYDIKE